MNNTITIRAKQRGDYTEIRMTIDHPMRAKHCGYEVDETKQQALFIQEVRCLHDNELVILAQLGPALSENPYFAFRFKGGARGDKITVSWVDNQGNRDDQDAEIH